MILILWVPPVRAFRDFLLHLVIAVVFRRFFAKPNCHIWRNGKPPVFVQNLQVTVEVRLAVSVGFVYFLYHRMLEWDFEGQPVHRISKNKYRRWSIHIVLCASFRNVMFMFCCLQYKKCKQVSWHVFIFYDRGEIFL